MATDTSKIRSKLAKLDKSLDELESQLEPLLSQSLPETLLALDTIQQAKLQVIIPYVVYDLVFVYLKSRGVDPKTHRVVSELERVRQYFDKIRQAEDADQKKRLDIDKAAADRFIRHAITQAKNAQPVDESSAVDTLENSSSNAEHVPVKVTSKMIARAEYERELQELGSEEEGDLEMLDEETVEEHGDAMDTVDGLPEETKQPVRADKGKGRAEEDQRKNEEIPSPRYKRPRIGLNSSEYPPTAPRLSSFREIRSSPESTPRLAGQMDETKPSTPEDRDTKAAKKGKHKAKKTKRL